MGSQWSKQVKCTEVFGKGNRGFPCLMFRVSLNVDYGLISGRVGNVDCAVTIEVRIQTHETYCIHKTDWGCR